MEILIITTIAIAICCALGWLVRKSRALEKDGDWHAYAPSTYKMRRWRGKWEYRDMTPEEAAQHQLDNAV